MDTSLTVPTSSPPIRLSAEIRALAERCAERTITLGEVMSTLGVRASGLLILICALPFCSPVTIPGLSTPFGLAVTVLATRFVFGLPPWLPAWVRKIKLPPKTFSKILGASAKLLGWLERRMRPRWSWCVEPVWKLRLHSVIVLLSGVLLLVPFPPVPPFTNTLPALTVVILTMSTLERDGAGVVAGYVVFLGMIAYFVFWAAIIGDTFGKMLEKFGF